VLARNAGIGLLEFSSAAAELSHEAARAACPPTGVSQKQRQGSRARGSPAGSVAAANRATAESVTPDLAERSRLQAESHRASGQSASRSLQRAGREKEFVVEPLTERPPDRLDDGWAPSGGTRQRGPEQGDRGGPLRPAARLSIRPQNSIGPGAPPQADSRFVELISLRWVLPLRSAVDVRQGFADIWRDRLAALHAV